MRALSIRQPYAELILRGIKTIEYRSRATSIVGERFWIYVPKGGTATRRQNDEANGREETAKRIWSDELAIPGTTNGGAPVPAWLMEMAEQLILDKLPRGVIVGSAVIKRVEPTSNCKMSIDAGRLPIECLYRWHLADVERLDEPRKPTRHPQPVWFRPF